MISMTDCSISSMSTNHGGGPGAPPGTSSKKDAGRMRVAEIEKNFSYCNHENKKTSCVGEKRATETEISVSHCRHENKKTNPKDEKRATEKGNNFPNHGHAKTINNTRTTQARGNNGPGWRWSFNKNGAPRDQDSEYLPGRALQQQQQKNTMTTQTRGNMGPGWRWSFDKNGAPRDQDSEYLPGGALQQQQPNSNCGTVHPVDKGHGNPATGDDAILVTKLRNRIQELQNKRTGRPQTAVDDRKDLKWSKNPHFRTQVYNCMRYVRTTHAIHNWTEPPKGVANNLKRMAASLKPIGADKSYNSQLQHIVRDTGYQICQTTTNHLEALKEDIKAQYLQRSRLDEQLIFSVTTRKLLRAFERIPGRTIRTALCELSEGVQKPQLCGGKTTAELTEVGKKHQPTVTDKQQPTKATTPQPIAEGAQAPQEERGDLAPPFTQTMGPWTPKQREDVEPLSSQASTDAKRNKLSLRKKTAQQTESRDSTAARNLHFSPPKKPAKRRPPTPPTAITESNRFQILAPPDDDQLTQDQLMAMLEISFSQETPNKRQKPSHTPDSSISSNSPDELNNTVLCLAQLAAEAATPPRMQPTIQRNQTKCPPLLRLHGARTEVTSAAEAPTAPPETDNLQRRATLVTCEHNRIHQAAPPLQTPTLNNIQQTAPLSTGGHNRIQQEATQSRTLPINSAMDNTIRRAAPPSKSVFNDIQRRTPLLQAPPSIQTRVAQTQQGEPDGDATTTVRRPLKPATVNTVENKEWPSLSDATRVRPKHGRPDPNTAKTMQTHSDTQSSTLDAIQLARSGPSAQISGSNPLHQRSRSLGDPQLSLPIVHIKKDRKLWEVEGFKPHHDVLIIGDSNTRGWRHRHPNWLINCFPGAHLEHFATIMARTTIPAHIKTIIVAVGVNNRNNNKTQLTKIMSSFKDNFDGFSGTTKFLLVSKLPGLRTHQRANLDFLDKLAYEAFGTENIIQGPPPEDINSWMPGEEAHYDDFTAREIITCIDNHLKSMRLN